MSISTTAEEVKNLGLSLLGADDYAAGTDRAAMVDRYYDLSVREEQKVYAWPELITLASLTGTAHPDTTNRDGYYQYDLATLLSPDVCLRIVEANYDFDTEDGVILTQSDTLVVRYLKREDTVTAWSDELERCIAHNLAARAAAGILKNAKIAFGMWQLLKQQIRPEAYRDAEFGRGQDTSIPQTKLNQHLAARFYTSWGTYRRIII